ncbi:MAG: fbiA [Aeromicrobium sp.]|nr:fbiA [Aeromicrobium sp.]
MGLDRHGVAVGQNGGMRITVLSGGVGGARFISGLLAAIEPDDEITVIGNTADDIWLFGLRVCPDLDTVMYTLGDGIDPERKWGRTDETWKAKEELAAYGVEETWFGLGDRDLATHILRTQLLHDGVGLAAITERLCDRWKPGVRLLPMTEDPVETHISIDGPDGIEVIHFQEYWIRLRAGVPVRAVSMRGAEDASAGPGVVEAILGADRVILPPSNPVVSTGAILSVGEVADAVRATTAPVVGVSPIIGGAAVRGMADQLLTGLGVEISATGVARYLGSRSARGVLDGWLVDTADAGQLAAVEALGIAGRAVPLYMSDDDRTAQLARDTLALADELA